MLPLLNNLSPPNMLDRYQLVARIGKGGMAEVFHAKLQSIGGFERDVAVKILLPQFASEPEFVEMLLDEARIAGAIDHPCVVQVLDVGRQEDIFYLVMEYVDGQDLRSLAKQRGAAGGKLPLEVSLHVIGETLRGLAAVHGSVDADGAPRRIVHRDVSPSNVMVSRRGLVKLGDFGIAHASGRLTQTRAGAVKGKSRYMAPEQLNCQPVDHRADLYAVGVTLFEALLGDVARESSHMTPYGPMFTWPQRIESELCPPDVVAILKRALAEDVNLRYPDAESFRIDVAAALNRRDPGYGAEELAAELNLSARPATPVAAARAIASLPPRPPSLVPESRPMIMMPSAAPSVATVVARTQAARAGELPAPLALQPPLAKLPPPSQLPLPRSSVPSQPRARLQPLKRRGHKVERTPTAELPPANFLQVVTERPTLRSSTIEKRNLVVWAAAAGGAVLLLALTLLVVLTHPAASAAPHLVAPTRTAAAPPISAQPTPTPTPATPTARATTPPPPASSRATTGTLAVTGPAGAHVTIGSTGYVAPCRLELAPGSYTVHLKLRRRQLSRRVVIAAGQVANLSL